MIMGDLIKEKTLPLTPADRLEKQLKAAGYNVERSEVPDGSLFLEVLEYVIDSTQKKLLKTNFEYDSTGNIFKRMFVSEFPLVVDLENEKILMG